MVPVQVGDEDLGDLPRLDAASLQLDLGAFSTVKYPDIAVILRGDCQAHSYNIQGELL